MALPRDPHVKTKTVFPRDTRKRREWRSPQEQRLGWGHVIEDGKHCLFANRLLNFTLHYDAFVREGWAVGVAVTAISTIVQESRWDITQSSRGSGNKSRFLQWRFREIPTSKQGQFFLGMTNCMMPPLNQHTAIKCLVGKVLFHSDIWPRVRLGRLPYINPITRREASIKRSRWDNALNAKHDWQATKKHRTITWSKVTSSVVQCRCYY